MQHDLIDRLLNQPSAFSLFQAIYLLQQAHPDCCPVGTFEGPENEVVRLKNSPSLNFPSAQIVSIEEEQDADHPRYSIETTLEGMYGILSPLPLNYSASLVGSHEDGREARERLRDFLDLFNHRLLSLAYRSESYRHIERYEPASPRSSYSLAVLSSLGQTAGSSIEDYLDPAMEDLATARIMMSSTRSAKGLQSWLRWQFPGTPINIEEFSPQWIRVPDDSICRLGESNCRLSDESAGFDSVAAIGDWMLDRETKFRVAIGPLNWEKFLSFLPGRNDFAGLVKNVALFIQDWFTYDVMLQLGKADCIHLRTVLDGETSQLGFTAGLFTEEAGDSDLFLLVDLELTGDDETERSN